MAKAKVSKSAQIREALKATPDKPAPEIAKDVGVSIALVYNVKASLARKKNKAAAAKKGAGKKATATNSAGESSKAQRIRDVAKTLGKKVRPRDVIAELAKEGVKVSSAQVSTTLRSAGYRRKRRGKRVAAAAAAHPATGNGLNVEALIAAKALIAKVGGVEAAEEAIKVLKKLG